MFFIHRRRNRQHQQSDRISNKRILHQISSSISEGQSTNVNCHDILEQRKHWDSSETPLTCLCSSTTANSPSIITEDADNVYTRPHVGLGWTSTKRTWLSYATNKRSRIDSSNSPIWRKVSGPDGVDNTKSSSFLNRTPHSCLPIKHVTQTNLFTSEEGYGHSDVGAWQRSLSCRRPPLRSPLMSAYQ